MDYFFYKDPDTYVKGEIAELFLSKGTNVNLKTKNGVTTLHVATQKGYTKVVEALSEYNGGVTSVVTSDITPPHLSAQKVNELISKMLLNKGADVNAREKHRITALHIAVQKGHEKVVDMLKYGTEYNSGAKGAPLHIAAQKGYSKIIEILLKFGSEVDSRDGYG